MIVKLAFDPGGLPPGAGLMSATRPSQLPFAVDCMLAMNTRKCSSTLKPTAIFGEKQSGLICNTANRLPKLP